MAVIQTIFIALYYNKADNLTTYLGWLLSLANRCFDRQENTP